MRHKIDSSISPKYFPDVSNYFTTVKVKSNLEHYNFIPTTHFRVDTQNRYFRILFYILCISYK